VRAASPGGGSGGCVEGRLAGNFQRGIKAASVKARPSSKHRCIVFAVLSLATAHGFAKVPFDSAKVTRVENKVTVGEVKDGRVASRRPTTVEDVIRANNFVQTGGDSRAELEFKDRSLVRVGQNSVFSFDARSRSLSLDRGDMLFYIAPGTGGGTIKTPALTAGVTGTLCKVATDMIAVLRGSITINLDRKVVKIPAGYAVRVIRGRARIYRFDTREATRGKLYAMGPLPEFPLLFDGQAGTGLFLKNLHERNAIDAGELNPQRRNRPTPQFPVPVLPQTPGQPVTGQRNPFGQQNPPGQGP
jgi:hypothetical protein